ncbi:unnamed protein product, partial [Staurois parvus]
MLQFCKKKKNTKFIWVQCLHDRTIVIQSAIALKAEHWPGRKGVKVPGRQVV